MREIVGGIIAVVVSIAAVAFVYAFLSFALIKPAHSTLSGAALDASVMVIDIGHGLGAGVYIGNGLVITAGHVASHAEKEVPMSVNGIKARAVWIVFDDENDVALLKLDSEPKDAVAADLACGTPDAVVGDDIEVIGHPLGLTFFHSWGRIGRNLRDGKLQADVTIAPGNSGGPAFHNGKVVGIIVSMQNAAKSPMAPPVLLPITQIVPRSTICRELSAKHDAPTVYKAAIPKKKLQHKATPSALNEWRRAGCPCL